MTAEMYTHYARGNWPSQPGGKFLLTLAFLLFKLQQDEIYDNQINIIYEPDYVYHDLSVVLKIDRP